MEDLKMSQKDYQLALTVFFFTYSTFDIPCNMLLKILRPNIWLPTVTLVSGVVTVAMGMTQSGGGLIAARLILGMTECGLFPGVAYVITLWYRKKEAQFRQALFFCAASMAGAFAGALAVGLAKMDGLGGLEGWRWILIIEGLLTVVIAIAAYWLVLDVPSRTTFLSAEERELLLHRLSVDEFGEEEALLTKEESEAIHVSVPKSTVFKQVFTDYHLPLHIFVFWGVCCPLYSISLCLPTIVMEMGYTRTMANFLTIPIYITACIVSLFTAFFSDRTGKRTPFLAVSFATMFLGFLIAAVAPKAAYAGVFIAACGVYPAFPGMITWCSNNLASHKKRSIAMAVHIGMGSFGGAMGPNFYRHQDAPRYLLGHLLSLGFVTMGGISGIILYWRYNVEKISRFFPLYANADLRDTTSSAWILLSALMISSVTPSEKNSFSASALMLEKGSTATDGFCLSNDAFRCFTASAAPNSESVRNRSFASSESARPIADATVSEMDGTATRTDGGLLVNRFAISACGESPENGGSPVSISYTTQARLYSSLRPSRSFSPAACSGLIYAGVPRAVPTFVSVELPDELNAFAIPKSVTSAEPS